MFAIELWNSAQWDFGSVRTFLAAILDDMTKSFTGYLH